MGNIDKSPYIALLIVSSNPIEEKCPLNYHIPYRRDINTISNFDNLSFLITISFAISILSRNFFPSNFWRRENNETRNY